MITDVDSAYVTGKEIPETEVSGSLLLNLWDEKGCWTCNRLNNKGPVTWKPEVSRGKATSKTGRNASCFLRAMS